MVENATYGPCEGVSTDVIRQSIPKSQDGENGCLGHMILAFTSVMARRNCCRRAVREVLS